MLILTASLDPSLANKVLGFGKQCGLVIFNLAQHWIGLQFKFIHFTFIFETGDS
jgi:hypothetical protein